MLKISTVFSLMAFSGLVIAGPILQMNRAFMAMTDLVPYLSDHEKFIEKKNAPEIEKKIAELQSAFKDVKHDPLIQNDLFAPSYLLINENIIESQKAFKSGNKDYAQWRLKEISTHCLDCHTRLPVNHASSFQNGELTIDEQKFDSTYNLGIAQLIVRRYPDAKTTFTRDIDEHLIKNQMNDIILPFKQLLLIDTKVLKNPKSIKNILTEYRTKKNLPEELKTSLVSWLKRLDHWQNKTVLEKGLNSEKEVDNFISKEMIPIQKRGFNNGEDVDLLFASGLLSNYMFLNPDSKKNPEISYWLGWAEKRLKRENFFGSGDLFLKQCIKNYPKDPISKKCLEEYKESVEFDFSGSAGTNIPNDVQKELRELELLIKKNDK
jgi:hypothetical protein